MENFSQRYGHKPVRALIQIESVDDQLRNSLWSLLKIHVWDHVRSGHYDEFFSGNLHEADLFRRMWFSYFKAPLDTLKDAWQPVLAKLRKHFFECAWYEVYDFIEFVANNYKRSEFKDRFTLSCNNILEREVSAYRFVDGVVVRLTDQQEIAEIELALEQTRGPVQTHLKRALELLSERESPDFRNSIKESISAVESLVATTVGEKGTLGQLIKKLESKIGLHPTLRTAFSNLYGYTSDGDGIRHALLDLPNLGFEDAKFFLVVCSAFINFVAGKVAANERK